MPDIADYRITNVTLVMPNLKVVDLIDTNVKVWRKELI